MYSVVLLLLALFPLPLAPWIARWADRSESARSVMDSFVAVTLGGIVVLYIWPEAFAVTGVAAVVCGLLGFALPYLLHGQLHAHEKRAFPGLVWLSFLGLALHALLDGVALFAPESEHGHEHAGSTALAVAVVLHRFPTALAIWWLVVPRLGRRSAAILLTTVGAATAVGFAVAGGLLGLLSAPGLALFQAAVAGMLMHVVFGHEHRHAEAAEAAASRRTSAAGAAVGVALLVVVSRMHPMELLFPGELETGSPAALLRWISPPLLLGSLIWTLRALRARR